MLALVERACLACLALLLVAAAGGAAATFGPHAPDGEAVSPSRPTAATRALKDPRTVERQPASDSEPTMSATRLTGPEGASGPAGTPTRPSSEAVAVAGIAIEAGAGYPAAPSVSGVAGDVTDADGEVTAPPVAAGDDAGASDGGEVGSAPDGDDASATGAAPVYTAPDGERIDAGRLRRFLEDRDAPLAAHAKTLVRAGVAHGVDPRIVVGIAVAESAGGERLPEGTHNAWGWSGGGPHGLKAWPSWPAAIDDFTARYARLYGTGPVDAGIAQTYVPPNWQWWLETVTWVVDDI